MTLLGTSHRPEDDRTPAALIKAAGDAGYQGLALGPWCTRTQAMELVAAGAAAGLTVPAAAAPLLAAFPLPPGKRLPFFAAEDDAEERLAAVDLFAASLDAAVPLGVNLYTLHLGDVTLGVRPAEVARRYKRRELDEDEPGAKALAAAFAERRARSPRILDACRFSLERVLARAERAGITVALEVSGGPWGAPSPREAATLLDEFRDGPLGVVWDDARMQVLWTLGATPAPERIQVLLAGTRLRRANQAVGIDVGFLPGQGDPDPDAAAALPAPGDPALPVVVSGRPDSTVDELRRARELAVPPATGS